MGADSIHVAAIDPGFTLIKKPDVEVVLVLGWILRDELQPCLERDSQ